MAAVLNLKNAVVLFLSMGIILAGLFIGPGGQTIDIPGLRAVDSGPSMALAHKKCPPNKHKHFRGYYDVFYYTYGTPTQAGPNGLRYKWKKNSTLIFTPPQPIGTKVCYQ